MKTLTRYSIILLAAAYSLPAATATADTTGASPAAVANQYLLGPGDQIKIWSLGMEEVSDKPMRIDPSGNLDLPTVGKVHAGGLTLSQFKDELTRRFAGLVRQPQVSVEILEYGSQPVSVMGSVGKPDIVQLQGRKTLTEVISLAGGLTATAGARINIARPLNEGPIPLPNAKPDPTGLYSVADVPVKELMAGDHPSLNILVRPHDTITVPPAEMVYVVGEVKKTGPVALDQDGISTLQALAMAGGFDKDPKPTKATIIRTIPGTQKRINIPVNLKKVMAGKAEDLYMRPNDILLVPTSERKKAAARGLEAALQAATGVAIWRIP
jgi:polysaccharide export outer membrane protein